MVGGNAVAEWVAWVDEDAVRNTRDVDLLIRRADFAAAKACLEAVGFIHHEVLDVDTFIDGPQGKPSGGIHLLYAGENEPSIFKSSFLGAELSDRQAADRLPANAIAPKPMKLEVGGSSHGVDSSKGTK